MSFNLYCTSYFQIAISAMQFHFKLEEEAVVFVFEKIGSNEVQVLFFNEVPGCFTCFYSRGV